MKCKVCGAESGKYPLCRACNLKREKGEIIKCLKCGNWHYNNMPCSTPTPATDNGKYLYQTRRTLISKSERGFFDAIRSSVPEGYCVFPQINLASFIDRTDDARFHNELFRNVDFLVTDAEYIPKFIVEINDQTHLNNERRERDEKVQKICEEAGIPILKLWTSYGINPEYIKSRINETLSRLPVARVHHFNKAQPPIQPPVQPSVQPPVQPPVRISANKKNGCYIATCVYGSYDCPEVWVLRRYRDNILDNNFLGRFFIKVYYAFSPNLVRLFGKQNWFVCACKSMLNRIVNKLQDQGIENSPYNDKY
ncbi:MAG: DUF2726 domain-containing protein [Clostridia bacterium]|nr:DUF2726 domain-containing protein [Clostridia bacterium]